MLFSRLFLALKLPYITLLIFSSKILFSQCSTGCDILLSSSSTPAELSTTYSLNSSPASNKICFDSRGGSFTYSGTLRLSAGSTTEICSTSTDSVIFANNINFRNPNSANDRDILIDGNLYFATGTGIMTLSKADITLTSGSKLTGEGDIHFDDAIFDLSGTVTASGQVLVANGADITLSGVLIADNINTGNSATLDITSTGCGETVGNFNVDSPSISITGFFKAGGTITFNRNIDIQGLTLEAQNLLINESLLTGTGANAATFYVSGNSTIATGSTAGTLEIIDATNPNSVDSDVTGGTYGFTTPLVGTKPTFGDCSSIGGPLPVELTGFDICRSDNNLVFNWTTSKELNNDYFRIEHSTDLEKWNEVETIYGQGNSTEERHYIISVPNMFDVSSSHYFRIKQVDLDGSSSFSSIVVYSNDEMKDLIIIQRKNQIIISSADIRTQEYILLNENGQIVLSGTEKVINLNDLANGLYFLKIGQTSFKFAR